MWPNSQSILLVLSTQAAYTTDVSS